MHSLTPEQVERIRELVAAGRKIEAIKEYRAATGSGLKDARDAVETITRDLGGPDQPTGAGAPPKATSGGCALLLALPSAAWMLAGLLP